MRIRAIAVTAVALLALTGCADAAHEDAAPIPHDRTADMRNVRVWRMPDGFRNVTIGCDGPNLVYVTSAGGQDGNYSTASGIYVVPNDPYCQGVTR